MSDNRNRYRAIKTALQQLYPQEPTGRQAQHLNTLAGLMSGIVGSESCQLPEIANKVPGGSKKESRVKQFYRWLTNPDITPEVYFIPYIQAVLTALAATHNLLLAIDGSTIGRGGLVLLISVIYKKRALPIAWLVVSQKKGHVPEDLHLQLLQQVYALIPADATVILVGDGEFDGLRFQTQLTAWGWDYVCRTAKTTLVSDGTTVFPLTDLWLQPGDCYALPDVTFTAAGYGPVQVLAWWDAAYAQPLYLVTNLDLPEEARHWYRRRYRIETFFADQKSRGFNLQRSHLADPARLSRLLIAACLAYIWLVHLGVIAHRDDWVRIIHRPDRCDLSLFHLGRDLLEHFLNMDLPIPVAFTMPEWSKSVR